MRTSILCLALLACTTEPGTSTVEIPDIDNPTDTVVDPADPLDPVDTDAPELAVATAAPAEMIFSSDGGHLYIADVDNGAVHVWLDRPSRYLSSIELGSEPTRLTRRGTDVWVTLRGDGEVVHLREQDETLVEVRRAWVGTEPFDILASDHSDALFVSLSQEDAVVQLDPDTLQEVARYAVDGEPRWMAAPDQAAGFGEVIHVSSAMKPLITTIDPASSVVVARDLPAIPRFTDPACDTRLLHRRITGAVALSPSGRTLYVPAIYADPLMPEAPVNGEARPNPDEGCPQAATPPMNETRTFGYGFATEVGTPAAIGRFEPTLVRMPLDTDSGEPELIHLAAASLGPAGGMIAHRGVPRSVVLSQSYGDEPTQAVVTMESSNNLIILDFHNPSDEVVAPGFTTYNRAVQLTGKGPLAAQITPGEDYGDLWVYNWLSRDVQRMGEWRNYPAAPTGGLLVVDDSNLHVDLPDSALGEDIKKGRRLFYSSDTVSMVDRSFGTACSNCHPDGRTDGFTWRFPDMWRQTPSLAGRVSDTLPLTWLSQVPTVEDEITITTTTLMGGQGPNEEQLRVISTYIDWLRTPHRPAGDPDQVSLGDEVFHRPEVGCAACHSGPAATNGQSYDLFGEIGVDTPTLRGIGATAPYFHDGTAATLRDVLERSRDGSMGYTGGLTDEEMDALEAYLLQR